MAKDPICGMEVDESKALKLQKDSKTYFFCSKSCHDEFLGGTVKEKSMPKSPLLDKGEKMTIPME